jgi:hypothetical protein
MNTTDAIDGEAVVHTALANVERWDEKFMFMDGRNGDSVPF